MPLAHDTPLAWDAASTIILQEYQGFAGQTWQVPAMGFKVPQYVGPSHPKAKKSFP